MVVLKLSRTYLVITNDLITCTLKQILYTMFYETSIATIMGIKSVLEVKCVILLSLSPFSISRFTRNLSHVESW